MIRLRWVLFWAISILITAVLSTALFREFCRVRELEKLVKTKEDRLKNLSEDIKLMREKASFYRTSEGKARLARENFNLILPGEKIYKIIIESDDQLPIGRR